MSGQTSSSIKERHSHVRFKEGHSHSKCSETMQHEVQKCIKFAAKVSSNGEYLKRDHVSLLLRDLKWINFNSILRQMRHPLCIKI